MASANTANGTPVQLWTCNGTTAQRWSWNADGSVRALGSASTWPPDQPRAAPRQLYDCNGTGAQKCVQRGRGHRESPGEQVPGRHRSQLGRRHPAADLGAHRHRQPEVAALTGPRPGRAAPRPPRPPRPPSPSPSPSRSCTFGPSGAPNAPFAWAQTARSAGLPRQGCSAPGVAHGAAPVGAVRDTVRSVSLPRDQVIDLLEARSWMSRPARRRR
ncbi:RICIN domain-containing protein [Micromonospora sp. BRA006-A]|nr:RICIN domain-containing protein [Micromonospora sp. BRA006-A]